jgi:hypothetical protein
MRTGSADFVSSGGAVSNVARVCSSGITVTGGDSAGSETEALEKRPVIPPKMPFAQPDRRIERMKIRREGTTLFENICRITLKKLPYLPAFVNHPISPSFAINHSLCKTAHLSFFIFIVLTEHICCG